MAAYAGPNNDGLLHFIRLIIGSIPRRRVARRFKMGAVHDFVERCFLSIIACSIVICTLSCMWTGARRMRATVLYYLTIPPCMQNAELRSPCCFISTAMFNGLAT